MPKLKTHKGLSKVAKKRPGGTVKFESAGKNHKSGKKNAAFNRSKRKSSLVSSSDMSRLKDLF